MRTDIPVMKTLTGFERRRRTGGMQDTRPKQSCQGDLTAVGACFNADAVKFD